VEINKMPKCLLCGESADRFFFPIAREIHLIVDHEYTPIIDQSKIMQLVKEGFAGSTYEGSTED